MLTFTNCYSTNDDFSQIQEWYEERGWSRYNERLLFPGIKIGTLYFELGNQYNIHNEDNNTLLIIQQKIYRISDFLPVNTP